MVLGISSGIVFSPPDVLRDGIKKAFFSVHVFLLLFVLFKRRGFFDSNSLWAVMGIVLFLYPSGAFSFSVKEAARFSGSKGVFSAILAFSASASAVYFLLRLGRRLRTEKAFTSEGLVLFLSSVNLLRPGGGEGFSHLGFVLTALGSISGALKEASLRAGELLLLPKHDFVVTRAEKAMGFLAGAEFSFSIVALLLLLPPLVVSMRIMLKPEPDTGGVEVGALRRKITYAFRAEVLLKAVLPVFALLSGVVSLHAANMSLNPLYEPEPVPLLAEDGVISAPLSDSGGDVSDGRIRKYSVGVGGSKIVFIVMMRPDGEVKAALDACEVCPPDGYGQRGGALICKYCNTPIPAETLGRPGGCNPIPVESELKEEHLVIKAGALSEAFKEAGKKLGQWH